MKTLYLECSMGAAGDMLMAALLELYDKPDEFIRQMNGLGLAGVQLTHQAAQKCGIMGSRVEVLVNGEEEQSVDVPCGELPQEHSHGEHHHAEHDHDEHHHGEHDHHGEHHHHGEHDHAEHHHGEHHHGEHHHGEHHHAEQHHGERHSHTEHDHAEHHSHGEQHHHGEHHHAGHDHHGEHHHEGISGIMQMISALPLSARVKADAIAVYGLIAQAEAHVHGKPVEEVHFHEVGAKDAVADIVGCCLLIELLCPDEIIASPIHVGSGQVRCAHGVLPVPAPATAVILQGVPMYGGEVKGELCTPTGAALLKHFAVRFAPMPVISAAKIGYGMGKKDFAAANCLRAYLGESGRAGDEIIELCCNLDDMTGEALSCAASLLMEEGALDAFFTAIHMKKNRPAVMFTCLCHPADETAMTALILKHTTTLGVRKHRCTRSILHSEMRTVDTPYGKIKVKTSTGYGTKKSKPEFADVKAAAEKYGVPFDTVWLASAGSPHPL